MERQLRDGEAFLRCVLGDDAGSHGVPQRLVGEKDVFSFAPGDQLTIEAGGVQGEEHPGHRVRLTTHRLLWQSAGDADDKPWFAICLNSLSSVENWQRMFRSRRCVLHYTTGLSHALKYSKESAADDFFKQLQATLKEGPWRNGSYEATTIGGLQRILQQKAERQSAVGDTLDLALNDLASLKKHAELAVSAARQVAIVTSGGGYASTSPASGAAEGGDLRQLLEDFGCLLGPDGKPVVSGGDHRTDIEADVVKVCVAALEKKSKRGGSEGAGLGAMLLAHDAFCLVNRARGTALVTPEEVISALRSSSAAAGGPLRLEPLGKTGAFAVKLARSDEEADADAKRLVAYAEAEPLSAFSLSQKLGLTAAEANYLLRDAEQKAILVRDDAPEAVFYYKNFFSEY
eukprot:TRINITY_DN80419_c0_g1_i1.p1 TRINITY_DN80419_c0_g1~~TRINITY_DN80419_c0_g1_i1.p1  ORF type:complete len:402 (+),score=100.60 TRINITY_DN80419_c0_g1_i1:72-1277(+)